MIIEQKRNFVQQSSDFKSAAYSFSESGKAHLIGVLRNNLYSNKIGSLTREVISNGYDAAVEKNFTNPAPLKITLPTELELNFIVRDLGAGMSEEQIFTLYSQYGESSKRSDNRLIGGLGIGSKSPFCYTDSFIVNSYQGGTKKSYSCFIDETNIGKISKVGECDTDEDDGVEVSIPVNSEDTDTFKRECLSLFKYFPVRPIVTNDSEFYSRIKEPEILFAGQNWKYERDNYAKPRICLGIVSYPVETSKLNSSDPKINAFQELPVLIHFAIGELDVAASRESLQYTAKTIAAISDKLLEIYNHIESELSKQLTGCKSMFEAKVKFGELRSSMDSFTFGLFKQIAIFNGIKISSDNYKFDTSIVQVISYKKDEYRDTHTIKKYINGHRGTRYYSSSSFTLEVGKNPVILIDDVGMENHRSRITQWTSAGQEVFILKPELTKWAQYIIDIGFDIEPIKVSSLKAVKVPGSYSGTYNSKHSSPCFVYAPENKDKYKDSDWYDLVDEDFELDDGAGVYIKIDSFMPDNTSNESFSTTYAQAKQLLGCDIKLYAFKKKVMDDVRKNSNYIEFSVWLKTQLETYSIAPDKLKQWEEARYYNNELDYYDRNLIFNDSKLEVVQAAIKAGNIKNQEVIDAAAALSGINKYLGSEYTSLTNLFSRFNVPLPTGNSIKKEYNNHVKTLKDNYPLLNHTSDYGSAKGVQEYIKMCEAGLDKI